MRHPLAACLPAIAVVLLFTTAAKADKLFTLNGRGQSLTFSLPTSFAVQSSYSDGFTVDDISYTLNGVRGVTAFGFDNQNSDFFFGNGAYVTPIFDGFDSLPGDFFGGDALFRGDATAPVFQTGTFNETNLFGYSLPTGRYTLTISDSAAPVLPFVPEPSSLLLLGTGIAFLAGIFRRPIGVVESI
jgi:hypothetical protein